MSSQNHAGSATGIDMGREREDFERDIDSAKVMLGTQHDVIGWYYFDDETQAGWQAWQARAALARATPQHPEAPVKPLAYAIYGIGNGRHYVRDVKVIPADDTTGKWKSDDASLGEYWAGNEPLVLAAATPQHSVTEQADPAIADFEKWIQGRGPLGPGATPDRPFIAGWLAGNRRAQPLASTAATRPEQASIKTWQERERELPDANHTGVVPKKRLMQAEIDDLRAALAIPASTAASEQKVARDWIEDAPHENGNYQCRCSTCGNIFIGHKRRVTCKACAAASEQQSSVSEDDAFTEWWNREQACPEHNLITEDAARASWHERARRAALSGRATIPSEADALRAALQKLENANDVLCGLRTSEQYLSMIDGGQQDALEELDSARRAARALLAGRCAIPSEADERGDFEKAVRSLTHANDESFKRDEDRPDDYADYVMGTYWSIWKRRAALTHRATTATPGHTQLADALRELLRDYEAKVERADSARDARNLLERLDDAAAPDTATTAADQQGEQNSSSNISSNSGVAADQQGDTASEDWHLLIAAAETLDDLGATANATSLRAMADRFAQQGAAQAQAGSDHAD